MVIKRVLHPIGQGAFFTEQFYDTRKKAVQNVVYDCGSFTNMPTLLENEIRNTFEKNDHIDVLFISHFDEDHVNGLMALLRQATIDSETKVIIPFRYPYLLMVMEEDYPSLARFMMQIFNLDAQVIGVEDGNDYNGLGETIDIENLNGNMTLGGRQVIRVMKNQKPVWYYYPFMIPDLESLQKVFIDKIDGKVNLKDPCEIIEKRKTLRDIYKTVGKRKGGVTKINVNSLLMLSFPAEGIKYNANVWHLINLCGMRNPTCLYTGDANLKGKWYDGVRVLVTDILNNYSKGTKVGMVQVPHHGSIKCFPADIADHKDGFTECAFVNCNPMHGKKVFESSIIGEFTANKKVLILVTDNYHSRVEVVAELY